jgi:hypothetical protein
VLPDGRRAVLKTDAIAVFTTRTGRDPRTDLGLRELVKLFAAGLNAEARGNRRVSIGEEREACVDHRRGHPGLAPLLLLAANKLVSELGPANGALLLFLYGAHESKSFPISLAGTGGDVAVLLRRLEQRLSQMAKAFPATLARYVAS